MDSTEQDARLWGTVMGLDVFTIRNNSKLAPVWCYRLDNDVDSPNKLRCVPILTGSVIFGDDDNSGLVGRMRGMGWHILPGPGPDGQYQATAIRDVPKPKDETHRVTAPTPVAAAIAAMKAALGIAEAQG